MTLHYINIDDLMFNGAVKCSTYPAHRKPAGECIEVVTEYCRERDRPLTTYKYRGVKLGAHYGYMTIGVLDAVLQSLRGRGKWVCWRPFRGDSYDPFTPEEEKIIRRLGLWVF